MLVDVTIQEFATVEEAGADPILGTRGQVVIPEGGDSMIVGDAGTGKSTLRSTWHSTSPRVIPGPASQRRRRGRC
jgi:hypothetical protein